MRSAVGTGAATTGAADRSRETSTAFALVGLLAVGFVLRLFFIGADGFKNDVSTFEAWALTLAEHPLREFFAKAGFADYPPGYFFILYIVGHAYRTLVHADPGYAILKVFVKLPAIVMDLVDAALVFAIVRRFASLPWAFAAAAFLAFNPATIFISAYWGQVDSVAGGFTLATVLLVVASEGRSRGTAVTMLALAWLALGYSILIKPPAAVLVPLMLCYAFAGDRTQRPTRLIGTVAGIGAALVLAYVAALAFHPGLSPLAQFTWLYGRYQYASGVYAYNSVNAFNLYALRQPFWQPDSQLIPNISLGSMTIGFPQYAWGIGLFVVAMVLIVSRYLQRRDTIAFLEAAFLLSLGFFVLATRMHERYIFNALLFAPVLMFAGRRYVWAAAILSVTLFANLEYSLYYLAVMDARTPGLDASNLWPWISRPAAALNVATFFYLGYIYLGTRAAEALPGAAAVPERRSLAAIASSLRSWFTPLEGSGWMLPLDYAIAAFLTVVSFVTTYIGFWIPGEKIFDEIYYARAAEEYIAHKEIFEYTHPPLTKLIITLSTMMFGDNAYGWRFLNVVVGALTVFVLYAFAKRILRSTPFATICAGLLVLDGFHFVQSRIATPEITVAFFSLTTLYAFYRFWIASQVRVAAVFDRLLGRREAIVLCFATVVAAGLALLARGQGAGAVVVVFLYAETGFYLAIRLIVPRLMRSVEMVTSYAEGSAVVGETLYAFDGGRVGAAAANGSGGKAAAPVAGEATRVSKGQLSYGDRELRIDYQRGGAAVYTTPDGVAQFEPDGTMRAGGVVVEARDAKLWLWLLAFSGAALAASKWNGLFDFFVVFGLTGAVALQNEWVPMLRVMGLRQAFKPALWGNPRGFSVDVLIAAMLFVGATLYVLTYIPYFALGHGLGDLLGMQKGMFTYHYDLHATHPYSSKWWQWPLLQVPISYYYKDFRTGAATSSGVACCVAEILALPNPAVWWLGLVSVPLVAWLAYRERIKAYVLLITAYLLQWLPWIASPRIAFEYHFYPNLAIICIADAILLQRVWQLSKPEDGPWTWPRLAVAGFLVLVAISFVFWYPVLAGSHISYNAWNARMWTWLMNQLWINPHPGQ